MEIKSLLLNSDLALLVHRIKEAKLTTKRFLKVNAEKKAFEREWQLNLYSPEELADYPRLGICGGNGLVPLEADKPEMVEILRTILPKTLEVITPRRQLPHFFFKVSNGEIPNKTLHLPNDPQGAGEIRSRNQYFVAAGTTINFRDLETGEPKTGTYKILHDRPIAEISFSDFMRAITPYLGKYSSQKITKEIMQNGAEKGTRHAYGIRYATRLIRHEHLDSVAVLDIMKRWNKKCKPPMAESDLERMIKNAVGYAQNDPQEDKPLIPSTFEEQLWKSPQIVRHIFSDLGRRVKHDNVTKAAVFFSGLSACLSNPLNLFERGTSGSGKTYNAIETLKYFPQEDIWYLSGMSPKALVHQKSVILDKDGVEINISDKPKKPRQSSYRNNEVEYQKAEKEYEEEAQAFNKRLRESYHYINIENKIFVFLETPNPETMRMIYPILSHDKHRIEYRFVNKTASGLRTELVVIEGYPTTIFLTTDRQYVEELATRSFTVSPEESNEKITDANKLTNLKVAIPWRCNLKTPRFLAIQALIQKINNTLKNEDLDVIIPFLNLHELFPKNIARDMRDFSHFTQFLKSFTILHLFQRPVLVMEEKKYVIANNYDVFCCYQIFKALIESTRTGTEKRILNFYRDFMMKNGETFYVSTLTTSYNEKNESKLSDFTIRKWLNRLNEIGYVEKQEDANDKRKYLYVPLIKESEEKPDNVCDLEKKKYLLSVLEKGFDLWKENVCVQKGLDVRENFFSDKIVDFNNIKNSTLLNVQKLLTFSGDVFKHLSMSKTSTDSENTPKKSCVAEKQVISTNSEKYVEVVEYVRFHKDSDGLIDCSKLNTFIKSVGLKSIPINEQLLKDEIIANSPVKDCWVVVK